MLLLLFSLLVSASSQEMVATNEPGSVAAAPAQEVFQSMMTNQQDEPGSSYAPNTKNIQSDPGSGIGETTAIKAATAAAEDVVPEESTPPPSPPAAPAAPPAPVLEDEGDHIIDEIEEEKPVDNIEDWNLNHLVEETKKAEERKKHMEQKHLEHQQQKLREQALKLKKKTELDALVIEAERKCEKWTSLNDQSEAEMYDLFKEAVNASLAARDGSKYHSPPVLVVQQLHITTLGINALKCHASYIEKLSVFVEKTCEISKNVRTMLTNYIAVPNENVVLPSIETKDTVDYHIPTRTEINVLKLTAANAHAKVIAALKEYQLHSAKLEALEIEDEKDIDSIGETVDDVEQGTPPHLLPIEVLFKHIIGRAMEDEVPQEEKKLLESETKRIQNEMEDCFGKDCEDPKEYDGKKQSMESVPQESQEEETETQ